jgi:hypothetical protein
MKKNSQPEPQMVDALDSWAADAPQQLAVSLSLVRLDANEKLIVPFTTSIVPQEVHYLDSDSLKNYVQCPGKGCLLCRLGFRADHRDLVPVYDPIASAISVLAVSPNSRPMSLRAGLVPVFRRLKAGENLLVGIQKLDMVRFALSTTTLSGDADSGTSQIAAFEEMSASGAVDLRSVYPRLEAEELAAIPEIAKRMQLKGVTLP